MPLPSPDAIAAQAHLLPLLRAALKAANAQRFDEAERLTQAILQQAPDLADAVHMLAYIALHRGELARAEELARQAIALDFHFENYHLTLAQAQLGRGDVAGAKASCGAALGLNTAHVDTYALLAKVFMAEQDAESARAVLYQGLTYEAENPELLFTLGYVEMERGDITATMAALGKALDLRPDDQRIRLIYSRALRRYKLKQPDPALLDRVLPLLGAPGISPRDLAGVVENALRFDIGIRTLKKAAEVPPEKLAAFMFSPAFPALGENRTLLAWLRHGIVGLAVLESIFTALRRGALWLVIGKPLALEPHEVWLEALAQRNFHADYLDPETAEERDRLALLDQQITAAIAAGSLPPPGHLAIYACYRPLYRRPDAAALAALRWPAALRDLRRRQLDEPLRELAIAEALPALTPIEDATSRHVREMYEESPFPRWSQPLLGADATMGQVVRSSLPRQRLPDITVAAPQVLVAGCGTGLHAILAATNYRDAQVLALDLSRASLAYGKRKAEELGFSNISFAQADILQVGALPQRFDLIESFGVLHHLRDPAAGLAQLAKLLKPGGYMMLGLYSEVGRRDVVAARHLIAEHGYRDTPDDIRRFRADLPRLDAALEARLRRSSAFLSLPDFRDLVFHRQEHRYFPEQLGPLVANAGLRFLGFELSEAAHLRAYCAAYPDDPQAVNLAHWAEFERQNPDLFANCFRFWVDKPV